MKSQSAFIASRAARRVLFLILFLSRGAAFSQTEFDETTGTSNWIEFSDAPNALYHHIAAMAYADLSKRSQKVGTIHTLTGWQQRQQWLRKTLQEAIGAFPLKTPLNARIVRSYVKDGYHFENIVFESQPRYYVTATLFVPVGIQKAPAIVYCSGHSDNGYRADVYLNEILNFVRKGFVVFAFDPMGQGERLEYYDSKSGRSKFASPSYEHSYPGAQLFITGNTIARNFIWDGIRAVDYLFTRKEVDTNRIGITGRSGGGTQSAYIAAFDSRISAAAPENYITNFKRLFQSIGTQDAEQNFFYEIEKGLDMADLLAVRAPKPALVITTTRDMFPIQGALETAEEVKRIYQAYGQPQNFSLVTDDAPHASTQKNRVATYAFFQTALHNRGDSAELAVQVPSPKELQVTGTGQASTSLKGETAFGLNREDVLNRMQVLEAARRHIPDYFASVLQSAKELCGYREPADSAAPCFVGRIQRTGYVIEKYLLKGEGNYLMPYLVCRPGVPAQKAVLYLNECGKAADLQPGGDMEWLVNNGVMVVAPDLAGFGELGPGEFHGDSYIDSVSYNLWFSAMLVHRSIVGINAGDVVRLVNELKREGVQEIYGLAKKQMAPVLLHAAAFHPEISKVALIQPYPSYRALVMDKDYNAHFLHSTVAGSIGVYDLPDLAASLAPRDLLIAGTTDAGGTIIGDTDTLPDLKVIRAAYQRTNPGSLKILPQRTIHEMEEALKQWIGQRNP